MAFWRIVNVTVHGREHVPASGPVIIACTHLSLSDAFFVWGALRRPAVALAMAELWLKRATRLVMQLLGQIPVDRRNPASGRQAVQTAVEVLRWGGLVIIFPEGGISRDGNVGKLKRGVARMAFEAGASVIPARIIGSDGLWPLRDHGKFNRRHPVTLTFGEALNPLDYDGEFAQQNFMKELSDRLATLTA